MITLKMTKAASIFRLGSYVFGSREDGWNEGLNLKFGLSSISAVESRERSSNSLALRTGRSSP